MSRVCVCVSRVCSVYNLTECQRRRPLVAPLVVLDVGCAVQQFKQDQREERPRVRPRVVVVLAMQRRGASQPR